jgi:hypothetical protein
MAETQLKKQSLSAYYDAVALPALALAQIDAAHGKLPHEKQLEICETVEEVVEDLSDFEDADPGSDAEPPDLNQDPSARPRGVALAEYPILCVSRRSPLDQAASAMLAQILGKHGLLARVQPFTDVATARSFKIDAPDASLVCLSYFGSAGNPAHVRYLIRRLRRVMPNARFLAGFWMLFGQDEKAEEWRAAVGAHLVATSHSQWRFAKLKCRLMTRRGLHRLRSCCGQPERRRMHFNPAAI